MNSLFIIDGSSVLTTCFCATIRNKAFFKAKTEKERESFYADIPKINGLYVNGIRTMLRVLFNLISNYNISYMAVAWDMNRNLTFRKQMYKPYKANRAEIPVPLIQQYGTMEKLLHSLGIAQFKNQLYEADDIIGSLSKKFSSQIKIIIYSKDCDILQLANRNIKVWTLMDRIKRNTLICKYSLGLKHANIPKNIFEFNEDLIEYEYKLHPYQIPDYKGLAGDPCDNIPGIKGIGPRTAIPLICNFGSVENIFSFMENKSLEDIKSCFKSINILRVPIKYLTETDNSKLCGKEAALLSKKLATIKTDIPLDDVTLNDLKVTINFKNKSYIFSKLHI